MLEKVKDEQASIKLEGSPFWSIVVDVLCFSPPCVQSDLAVHKKKVTEVQQWLEFALSPVSGVSCRVGSFPGLLSLQ